VLLPLIGMVALTALAVPMLILQDLPLVPAILATLSLLRPQAGETVLLGDSD
jgi:hypothetical protein